MIHTIETLLARAIQEYVATGEAIAYNKKQTADELLKVAMSTDEERTLLINDEERVMSIRDQQYQNQRPHNEAPLGPRPTMVDVDVGGSQCQEAETPLQRMSRSFDQLDNALDELESLVQSLCEGPQPGGTADRPSMQFHSIQAAVRNTPDVIDVATKRIYTTVERLRDALLIP